MRLTRKGRKEAKMAARRDILRSTLYEIKQALEKDTITEVERLYFIKQIDFLINL